MEEVAMTDLRLGDRFVFDGHTLTVAEAPRTSGGSSRSLSRSWTSRSWVHPPVARSTSPTAVTSGPPKLTLVKKSLDVVGAVIESGGTILCTRRGPGGPLAGSWEFPGGKIEPGEGAREALKREIAEELSCEIDVGDPVTTTRHEYDSAIVTLRTFWCSLTGGLPQLSEHEEMTWLPAHELLTLEWAPADVPAVSLICQARQCE